MGEEIASLPLIGKSLRRAAVQHILDRWNGFISLPNRISGRPILEETYGDITPQQAAERIAAALRDPEALARKRAELLALSGRPGGSAPFPAGAASRLCDALSALPEESFSGGVAE